MATAATAEKSTAKPATDLDEVLEHVRAIREDFTSLAASTGKLAANQAKSQARRVGELAGSAAEKASTYRDAVADTVKEHPLAAIGIAALAGLVISSLGRR